MLWMVLEMKKFDISFVMSIMSIDKNYFQMIFIEM